MPLDQTVPNPASAPYRANAVGGPGGQFIADSKLTVIAGDLAELTKFNTSSSSPLSLYKNWGSPTQASFEGQPFADRTSFSVSVDDWDNGTDTTSTLGIALINYSRVGFTCTENSGVYAGFLQIWREDTELSQFIPFTLASFTQKFTLEIWDGEDKGTVPGSTGGYTYSAFEWRVLVNDLVVLESVTGTTRNYQKTLLGYNDWCGQPSLGVGVTNNSDCKLTVSEFSYYINGDDSCFPPDPPDPPDP